MKVLVFGALNIDLIFSVDHVVRPGETISAAFLEKSAGGKGANQAAALAKAGMEAHLAGKIGNDGHFLLDLLRSYGVNTEKVLVYPGATGQALIQLDRNKQNAIICYAGGNGEIRENELGGVLEGFGPGDGVLLQNEIPHTRIMMERAKERGMKIFFNPSPCDEKINGLPLDLTDVLFVNEIEGAALASLPPETPPSLILDRLTARFPATEIILTAGREGAYYGSGAVRERGEILDLPVADTTAAGDTFTGYYIAAREQQCSLPQALSLACKAASIAVSRKGAMQSIPSAGEVF